MNTQTENNTAATDPRAAFLTWMESNGVTVQFHSAGVDFSNWDSIQFRYRAEVRKGDKSEYFDYSGGCAAFLDARSRAYHTKPVNDFRGLAAGILSCRHRYIDCPDVRAAYQRLYAASKPDAASLLDCLKLYSSAADQDFEDWAADFGYDVDSRSAEKTWNACRDTSRRLRALVGREAFNALLELESL